MPTLHRLATLRDDVIFFVYLYQSWKYKVDYSRVNEFGQGGEEDEDPAAGGKADATERKLLEQASVDGTRDGKAVAPSTASGRPADGDARKRK